MHLMAARIQTVVQDLIKARGLTMARVKEKWYYIPIAAFLAAAALLYAIVGGGAHIAVQDNLDLFQAQYAMMKRTGTFFTQGAAAPFLGGISRDVLPSEFSLTALFYELFPPLAAYLLNYFCKIAVATASFALFAREICRIRWERLFTGKGFTPSPQLVQHEKALSVLCGFCYGLLNVFPAFGISFASIPLALYLLVKLWRAESRKDAAKYLAGLFLYPLLSYFSYFGLFLLGYVLAAWIIFTVRALIKREKSARTLPVRLFLAMAVLSAGYICFEYRLFRQMLFSDEVSIRSTIKMASLPLSGALREGLDVMINGMFHADGMQKYVILPLLVIWIVATALIRLQQNDMGPGIFRNKVLDGMDGAFRFEDATEIIGSKPLFTVKKGDQEVDVLLLTREEANQLFILRDGSLVLTGAALLEDADGALRLETTQVENILRCYPSDRLEGKAKRLADEGPFGVYKVNTEEKQIPVLCEAAAPCRWTLTLPENALEGLKDARLQIDYQGDIGTLFLDDVLISDNFCNGDTWEVGLMEQKDKLPGRMVLKIAPIREGANVNVESSMAARNEEVKAMIAKLHQVKVQPVYEIHL